MEYVARNLNLGNLLEKKSHFLFGPRLTGKSLLISKTLKNCRVYNLLESEVLLKLSRTPQRLREECGREQLVVIDEIQKLPCLLDEVHLLIEERGIRFLLTGSSARKLRREGVNLLGGRARIKYLSPFSFSELKEQFDLERAINHGLLPAIYFSDSPREDQESYVGTYLKEEIAAEAATRNLPAFSRFLEVAALCSGQLVNHTKISNDAQVARSTIQEYFGILKDTLIAHEVPAWKESRKRKPITTSKYYLFDVGIARFLQNRGPVRTGSPEFGEGFETYLFHELKTYSEHQGLPPVHHWRSASGYEVDFILGGTAAVEIKSSRNVSSEDLKGLKALREENSLRHYLLVSMETVPREADGISILPWQPFLERLWSGEFR